MVPSHDPDAPHPGLVFYGSCWRTPEGVERKRAHMRIYNAARNQTMEGRGKRLDESLRRTWRRRAQRIADHDARASPHP